MAAMKPARIALALSLTVVVVAVALNASANHIDVTDPNDSPGRLDISRVQVVGTIRRPIWKETTFREWSNRHIYERGFLLVFLDTFGTNQRPDYYALIHSVGTRLTAELFRDRQNKRDFRVSFLDVWRADRRSASVRVPLRKLRFGEQRVEYTWFARTVYSGFQECSNICFDSAPNGQPIIEPRPGVTPSPSP
jgi:hypothetical protein